VSYLTFYLFCVVFSFFGLVGLEVWDARHDKDYTGLSLVNIGQGALLVFIPVVNTFTCIGCFLYFWGMIAPNIMFFQPKGKSE
jgi:hypothetical protein